MRRAPPLLLLPLLLAAAAAQPPQVISDESIDSLISNDTIVVDNTNGTLVLRDVNGTVLELDGDPEEVVRKKRTFGDIVFRGLADVLGYAVARKPPQAFDFPPPLAPVPGIDTPLAGAVPAAPAPAAPAAATAPCGAARATGPPPCRAVKAPPPPPPPPQPKAAPPCPRPRAVTRPKPKPTPPPPPPPPPCAQPRANPATPAPCAPAPAPPAPPKADNLERITSNLRLNFNFNRAPAGQAAQVAPAPAADAAASDEQAAADNQEQLLPIAIEPRAAKLPQTKPRVYVDAFVVNNGVARRVDTVDAKQFDVQQAVAIADEDYLAYDDAAEQQALDDDDYEDAQESRGRDAAVKQFGEAVDQFWKKKKQQRRPIQQRAQRLPENHYQNVHFGDRDLNDDDRRDEESHQSLQRERKRPNRLPRPPPAEADDDNEVTTTTEDPRKSLKPRVLPPTEHNPNQIDTVTVRVPPIYREKRPRKLHRERPEHPDRDEEDHEELREYHHRESEFRNRQSEREREREYEHEHDADGDDSSLAPQTERPARRRRRRKHSRKTRDIDKDYYTAGDFDYYGKKVPVSKEEQLYMKLTVPPPTLDSDVARHEKPVDSGYFLEDHERLREDPSHRIRDDYRIGEGEREKSSERVDDKERSAENKEALSEDKERLTEDREKSEEDKERSGEQDRADSFERSDRLSPNARIRESGYQTNYVRARNVQVDDPRPPGARAPQP